MLSLDPTNIFFSIVFSLLGFCYIAYGKKAGSFYFILAGVSLVGYTFVTTTTAQVIWIGVALSIAPFLLDKYLG